MRSFFDFLIRSSFYVLFFLVPIIFTGNTSELFEFNKLWITFALTLIIGASWISKMIMERQVKILKTPLDIPIVLFLFSQLLSTIFSIDPHTSLWGYYTRFNGGLYSLLSYGFLYFAFTNNIKPKEVMRYVYVGIAAACFVALWGLPSHFGYDPTCLLFRGTLDVSCWTFAFQPMVRIFSTLGQPDWLAAYLVLMLLTTTGLGLAFWKMKKKFFAYLFAGITALFYVDLLYTKARSGFVAFALSLGIFTLVYILYSWRSFTKHALQKAVKQHSFFLLFLFLFAVFTFLIGAPLSQLDNFSFHGIQNLFSAQKTVTKALQNNNPATTAAAAAGIPVQEFGGTDSGKIRLFVWEGALQIFLHNPILGTGVETFGYAYYKYRPAGHNLTSEWDYLYNKAHNEFLNYLATTGILGFGTYLLFLGMSTFLMFRWLWKNREPVMEENKNMPLSESPRALRLVILGLFTGYVSILITNFFGFSVVIMNIYLFLIPAFVLFLTNTVDEKKTYTIGKLNTSYHVNEVGWVGIGAVWLLCAYFCVVLLRFWIADVSYAYGQNLDHANEYQTAYNYLQDAVATRPSEPTFQDELSINEAVLSTALFQHKDSTDGAHLRDESIAYSDRLTTQHPNVVTFWKSRVRIFYTLAQIDPKYLQFALTAIEKAAALAPTDAKVWYNLGLLYDQTGDVTHAITTMEQTITLKPDYRDAYYALALFYRQKALGQDASNKTVIDNDAEQKAVTMMHFILQNFGPNDDLKIKDTLSSWGEK